MTVSQACRVCVTKRQLTHLYQERHTMSVEETYNIWASQYDSDNNKTRDLEGLRIGDVALFLNYLPTSSLPLCTR